MTRRDTFWIGIAAGAAALLGAARLARERRAIDFEGRGVVITGGSRGLGLVLARQFAAQGARLCLVARNAEELERARAQLPADADVMTIRCDVRRRGDVRAAMDQVLERWSAVDVLINNAGVIQVGPLEHMTAEDFENAMATHFWGPLHLMFEAVPSMRRRGFGRIVNISSISGRIAAPHMAPYTASKFALAGLSDAVRAELDQYGIRVTTVSPGLMRTGSPLNAWVKGQYEAEYAWFSISDSTPGLSTSAEAAARQIIEACRYGEPELTITAAAKLGVLANSLMPKTIARVMVLATRMLPDPTADPGGMRSKRGRDSETPLTRSFATALTKKAAAANNEL